MKTTNHPGAMTAEILVALGEDAQDLAVVSGFDVAQVRAAMATAGTMGIVLRA